MTTLEKAAELVKDNSMLNSKVPLVSDSIRTLRIATCLECNELQTKELRCSHCNCRVLSMTAYPLIGCPHNPPKWERQ